MQGGGQEGGGCGLGGEDGAGGLESWGQRDRGWFSLGGMWERAEGRLGVGLLLEEEERLASTVLGSLNRHRVALRVFCLLGQFGEGEALRGPWGVGHMGSYFALSAAQK